MFNDILDVKIPIHPDIMEAAIAWAEYELQNLIKKRMALSIDGINNEMKELLKKRLGKFWWREYDASIDVGAITDGKQIKINWSKI